MLVFALIGVSRHSYERRGDLSKLENIDRIAAAVKAGKNIVDIIVSLLQKAFAIRL